MVFGHPDHFQRQCGIKDNGGRYQQRVVDALFQFLTGSLELPLWWNSPPYSVVGTVIWRTFRPVNCGAATTPVARSIFRWSSSNWSGSVI